MSIVELEFAYRALERACKVTGSVEGARAAVAAGAEFLPIFGYAMEGNNALHLAATHGHALLCTWLVEQGVPVDVMDAAGDRETPLHAAAAGGHAEVIRVLAANGGNVNAQTARGNAPLHLAAVAGSADAVSALLEAGASPDTVGDMDFTFVELAEYLMERPLAAEAVQRYEAVLATARAFAARAHLPGAARGPQGKRGGKGPVKEDT
jgi:hypothetical protein